MAELVYTLEADLPVAEFHAVMRASGLSERRPAEDPARDDAMLRHTSLIATARVDRALVGVARALTDFGWHCYLADLAVDRAHAGRGIGRALVVFVHAEAGSGTTLNLLAAPAAVGFYEAIGFERHPAAFIVPRWTRA